MLLGGANKILAGALAALVAVVPAHGAVSYPEGHFERVQRVTDLEGLSAFVEEHTSQGKTAPSWNDVTRLFEGNPAVAFADANLKESSKELRTHELGPPGLGGWPTIRYFSKETGPMGAAYEKVTDQPMCTELLDRSAMIDYVESYSGTVLCAPDGTNCSPKEADYLEKWKAKPASEQKSQLERLEGMGQEANMNPDLKVWVLRRMRILQRLLAATENDGEATEL